MDIWPHFRKHFLSFVSLRCRKIVISGPFHTPGGQGNRKNRFQNFGQKSPTPHVRDHCASVTLKGEVSFIRSKVYWNFVLFWWYSPGPGNCILICFPYHWMCESHDNDLFLTPTTYWSKGYIQVPLLWELEKPACLRICQTHPKQQLLRWQCSLVGAPLCALRSARASMQYLHNTLSWIIPTCLKIGKLLW